MTPEISVVIPVRNESLNVRQLYSELIAALGGREVSLATLTPRPGVGGRGAEINRALTGRPFSIGGQRYESGIGARANLEVEF